MGLRPVAEGQVTWVALDSADAVRAALADPRVHTGVGLGAPPESAFVRRVLENRKLQLWQLRSTNATPLGLAAYVTYDGPPYVFLQFLAETPNPTLAKDCLLTLIRAHFEQTPAPHLFLYMPRPIVEGTHAFLTDLGFDLQEELPTLDNARECAYVLERHTYVAYYRNL